jgi:hypothetical protein
MNLIQYETESGGRAVAAIEDGQGFEVQGANSVYDLAIEAIEKNTSLPETVTAHGYGRAISRDAILAEGRILSRHATPCTRMPRLRTKRHSPTR